MINCKFENGDEAQLRHVTIDAIVVNKERDKVLLVKRTGKLLEGGRWAMPGGFLDRDERIEEAVVREIKEETGYDGEVAKLFRVNSRPDRRGEDRQNVTFVFIVVASGEGGEGDWEVDDVRWFAMDDLPDENLIAFDHLENLRLFIDYLQNTVTLPIVD